MGRIGRLETSVKTYPATLIIVPEEQRPRILINFERMTELRAQKIEPGTSHSRGSCAGQVERKIDVTYEAK